jgi:hypothetical protein
MDRSLQDSVRTGRPPANRPVKSCRVCGGTWFQEVVVQEFKPSGVRGVPAPISHMPLTLLVCLCGTPFRPTLGGVRGGRTPIGEIVSFFDSFANVERAQKQSRGIGQHEAEIAEALVPRGDLEDLQPRFH